VDEGTNDSFLSVTNLGDQKAATDLRWDFAVRATLGSAADLDVYAFKTKKNTPGTMVVAIWPMAAGGGNQLFHFVLTARTAEAVQVSIRDGREVIGRGRRDDDWGRHPAGRDLDVGVQCRDGGPAGSPGGPVIHPGRIGPG
jgi:hypothetical protein